jgi:hypothetical protein
MEILWVGNTFSVLNNLYGPTWIEFGIAEINRVFLDLSINSEVVFGVIRNHGSTYVATCI